MSETISVYLDWTPNTNHSGFYVAREKGFYSEQGLRVKLLSPHLDDYHITPAKKLATGQVAFAVAPSETVISGHTRAATTGKAETEAPQAVAALLQEDLSAIVTLASSGIARPAQLDGKIYASYGARFEGRIVQQIIRQDGGSGNFKEVTPRMLGIWETILKEKADATWVFLGWEGVDAERKGVQLNAFKLSDYEIPYGYTPVLVANPSVLQENPKLAKAFLAATAQGYTWAAEHPSEAAQILVKQAQEDFKDTPLPEPLDPDMVAQSQILVSKSYLNPSGRWGVMDPARCDGFLDWLSSKGLLTDGIPSRIQGPGTISLDDLRSGNAGNAILRDSISSSNLFTNKYLP